MGVLSKFKLNKENSLSQLKNPFGSKYVHRVKMEYEKEWFKESFKWTAYVYFRNGNTSGDQKFEHEDFDVITKQIHDFIESL